MVERRNAQLLGCFDSEIISMVSSSSESCLSYSDDKAPFIGVGSGKSRLSYSLGGAGTRMSSEATYSF